MVGPAAFPVAKLGFLLIRQVSKPLAKSVAARARNSPFFKNWVCIPVAQMVHFYEVKMKMKALNIGAGKVTKVPKLTEAKAVEQGSEILSEGIIISIAASILIYEYNRSKEKDDAKEAKLKADRESIKNKIFELELKVEKQSTQIRNIAKTAIHLEEAMHKRSLKGLLGKSTNVPQELIKTVEDIPEIPKEVKPLELYEDKIEEKVDENTESMKNAKPSKTVPVKTSIQEIVEKHYAQPVLIENKVEESVQTAETKLTDKPGLVTESVVYALQNLHRNNPVRSDVQNSNTKDGIVTEALDYYFKGAKK